MRYAWRIANWERHQHYKDRNPPWIKLHYDLLASEDWVTLDDASRVLAVALMLIASRHDGQIPANLDYIKRVAYLNRKPNVSPLIDCGFLVPIADASTAQAKRTTETETEKEKEKGSSASADALSRDFAEWYDRYPRKVAKAKAEQAYRAARKLVDAQTLHDGLTRYLDNKPAYQDWKHPATWLNGRCWEDDYGPSGGGWKASELEALQ